MIREDGSGLSMGQKQRLVLARALLRKPKLLILDEVTANLDANTTMNIISTLNHFRGKITTVVVTHNPKMLEFCDKIIDLNKKLDKTLHLPNPARTN